MFFFVHVKLDTNDWDIHRADCTLLGAGRGREAAAGARPAGTRRPGRPPAAADDGAAAAAKRGPDPATAHAATRHGRWYARPVGPNAAYWDAATKARYEGIKARYEGMRLAMRVSRPPGMRVSRPGLRVSRSGI